ncbi:carbamoyl-phosphate synthase large subunit [Aquabacterium sp. NJ1]|uniref:acetyl-CoA carboxylase family protein n=1 Tax=Aquabacterium sp. NJ1 TaxID=1538295 RepID=UPI00052E2497|nr:carboxyl transferase domain-containing protein [Aquabacterium sp. NJ1]KGM42021.1 carbamoyl-phosphate synthase large subunit [Aquabacterium sp. NJ1]
MPTSAAQPVLLIANRGEIAIRIARAACELGWRTVGLVAQDEQDAQHACHMDAVQVLPGKGVPAYLHIAQVVEAALAQGCTHVHPGYGLLSENADFARACAAAGLTFVGPAPEVLDLLGDKAQARALARRCRVPVTEGIDSAVTLAQAQAFFAQLAEHSTQPAMMIKALAGGGGRGMRIVEQADDVAPSFARCQSEALAAFGRGELYVEQLVRRARHIEVQVLGDGTGAVSHAWERDCTVQRNHQKLVEIAPAPGLDPALRQHLLDAAVTLAQAVKLRGLCTFEFLLDLDHPGSSTYYFMESNPRLQVEHTVTEAITGLDLVQAQLLLSQGQSLADLQLQQPDIARPRGSAIQARINVERMGPDGRALPAGGTIRAYEPPAGPGIRVDGHGHAGMQPHPGFDTLLAKVIVHHPLGFDAALQRTRRALAEFRLDGVDHNVAFVQALLAHEDMAAYRVSTRWLQLHVAALLQAAAQQPRPRELQHAWHPDHVAAAPGSNAVPEGCVAVNASVPGSLVTLLVQPGDIVRAGQRLAVIEAMKMEFEIMAPQGGRVEAVLAEVGTVVNEGQALLALDPSADDGQAHAAQEQALDPDHIRPDLAEVIERHAVTLDERRPEAVAKRHAKGHRTARENVGDFLDEGSFIEYGALALASQRIRHKEDELIKRSPADGLIAGLGTVNAAQFGEQAARCMVLAYDYTVFAGTQGIINHKKTDRMLHLALQRQLPLILWAEGGGGRPNDEYPGVSLLDNMTFLGLARLSGQAPTIAIVNGRCFAGNASLAGCCDVIIATRDTTIGMAGPAMIEGGGLGKFEPEEVGPVSMQAPNGVIDIVVDNEQDAIQVAQQYIGYFQGRTPDWQCADQRTLRHVVPEKRTRVYDVREVIHTVCDTASVLELRRDFAPGMITALARIEGRPVGLIANDPRHLGGAIDAPGADKAARFMQLCDAYDIPLIALCDTPGFMVGPDAEKTATVRHFSRMFLAAASLTVPYFTVVLRKGYGLGAQAMTAGSLLAPDFTVAWPTGEFGPMGFEGAVRLGFSKQLDAIEDPVQRQQLFDGLVAAAYQKGKALNMAAHLELDDVIDPADTRRWLVRGLAAMPEPLPRQGRKRPFVDAW